MRQGLEQATISKYSMHPSLFSLRSSFSQSPSRADKLKCYLRFPCPSYSYMVRLLICNQLSHIDIIPIPFLQKSTAVMISFVAVQTISNTNMLTLENTSLKYLSPLSTEVHTDKNEFDSVFSRIWWQVETPCTVQCVKLF